MSAARRKKTRGCGYLFKRNGRGSWTARWTDHNGKQQQKSTRTTDRRAAQRILNRFVEESALRRANVIDPRQEALARHARRPISEHVEDFRANLISRDNSLEYIKLVCGRLNRIIEGCGFGSLADIDGSRVASFLYTLRADKRDANGVVVKRGISAQTSNFYLTAIRQFCRWLVRERRAVENPVAHLDPINVRTDRRRDRRALTPDELRKLIRNTAAAGELQGMTGEARALMYRLAAETGLRARELRSLRRADFNLTHDPTVTVQAAYAKNRRQDTIPLRPETAELIRSFLTTLGPAAQVFKLPENRRHAAKLFRTDLEAAGIRYRDENGLVADFHALRHTFISNLAAGGVHPKVAQALARHSTISLTMDRYSHTVHADLGTALEALPRLDSDNESKHDEKNRA